MVHLRTILLSCVALTSCAISVAGGPNQNAAVRVSVTAFDWAATLIAQGHFVADKKGAWKYDHPTRSQENNFIRDHGFREYAQWYLAVDERRASNSKARCKFPFGDFRNVHRCGLLAVKERAHEYGYYEIEDAATKLLMMIESAGQARQKSVD